MTSKERVLATFAGAIPDRPPLWLGMSDEFLQAARQYLHCDEEGVRRRFGDDFRRIHARYTGPERDADGHYISPFGVPREGFGYGMPLCHPLAHIASPADVEAWSWPDPELVAVDTLRAQAAPFHRDYAILGGDWSPFWHDAIDLTGMENLLFLMYDHPETAEYLFEHIVDYYVATNRKIFEEAADLIDIMFIGNDFGSQIGPMVGPAEFRRFLLPGLKRLIDLGHSYGRKVQLHCCGGIAELLDDMIAAGLDAIHAVQCSCRGMELKGLKERFGDRIVFNGAIDSHHILIDGTPETVRQNTLEVLRIMAPKGRYIAGASHDSILPETPVANILAMCDAVTGGRTGDNRA